MSSSQPALARMAFWFAGGAAVSVLFSIATCNILIALALVALLFSRERLRLPPIWIPLALFMLGTVISLALSGDAVSGRPQIRKFWVFLILLVVYSTFREVASVRRLVLCWAVAAAIVSGRGLVQFYEKYREAQFAGRPFYQYYVGERITGFMSHWMTFGGQLMIVLLLLLAFLFFSPRASKKLVWAGVLCAAFITSAMLAGFTRSIWLATAAGGLYLLWFWQRKLLFAVPVVVALGMWLAPGALRSRVNSAFRPQKVDSNQFRVICWRTGWSMIKAHPWFGLGPEQVRLQFDAYLPSDVSRPLPDGWYGHLHSIYVHYAAERGVITMLTLVWLLVKILCDYLRAVLRLPPGPSDEKFLLHGGIAVVLAIMIGGIFELNLGDSEVLILFLAAVCCGYAAREQALKRAVPEP